MKIDFYELATAQETKSLAAELAARLSPGDLVLLSGPLGAGKTTFVQGLAAALEVEDVVSSPTFVLMAEYIGQVPLLHMDAYRLEDADAEVLTDAGVFDFLSRNDAIKLIEWPEMLNGWLPEPKMEIELSILETGGRAIRVLESR